MNKETYKMKLIIEDLSGTTEFSREIDGDAPNVVDFANFCHAAASGYGFSDSQLENYLPYHWDDIP